MDAVTENEIKAIFGDARTYCRV